MRTTARSRATVGALIQQAVRAIAQHKGRAALNALSVAIGIVAVVWVVAIGRAGERRAEAMLDGLGRDLVYVSAGSLKLGGRHTGSHAAVSLTADDAQAILAEVPRIKSVAVMTDASATVVASTGNWTTQVRGISVSFLDTWRWTMVEGVAFTERDVHEAEPVALLGRTVRERLFGDSEAVGHDVRIGSFGYHVIGVLGVKGQSPWGRDQDDVVFLPYTTWQRRIRGKGFAAVDDIMCRAGSKASARPAAAEIVALLRERHHLAPGEDDDFHLADFEETANADLEVGRTFATLLTSVACISLVVGGVGIMNVMLASVAERTREIGLRMAVGATDGAVQGQLLAESVILCLLGGVGGVVASAAGPPAMKRILGWDVPIPVEAVVVAPLFAVAVGLFFGVYPAWKAARLDPITALRQE